MRTMLFVYGTLKVGGHLHHLLEMQQSLGEATVLGLTLYNFGRFPAAVLRGTGPIHGEVFFVDEEVLKCIDHIEGVHKGLFKRISRTVRMQASGNWVEVELYVWDDALPMFYHVGTEKRPVKEIAGGKWQEPKFHLDY